MNSTFTKQKGGTAVIYLRVSTEEQVDNYSLETQETGCIQEAQRRGLKILQIFREEGKSAKSIKGRPMLLELLALCGKRQREINTVIIYRVDRLARQTIDYLSIRAKLARMDISVISVNEPTGDSPMDKLTETLLAGIAQFENEVRSERSKQGMRARFLTGLPNGLASLGYVNDQGLPPKPDPLAFEAIKSAWETFGTGTIALRPLAEILNKRGVYCSFPKPHLFHIRPQTLSRIFRNKFYAGVIVSKKYQQELPGRHPAMISEELFYRVQRILDGRNKNPKHLVHRSPNNPDFPLRHVVRCAQCGHWFSGAWSKGNKSRYAYYFCNKRCRTNGSIPVRVLDGATVRLLARMSLSPQATTFLNTFLRQTYDERSQTEHERRIKLTAAVRKLHELKQDLTEKHLSGKYSDETFQEQNRLVEAKLQRVLLTRDAANTSRFNLPRITAFVTQKLANLVQLYTASSVEQKRSLILGVFPNGLSWCYPGYAEPDHSDLSRIMHEAKHGLISQRWKRGDQFEQLLDWFDRLAVNLTSESSSSSTEISES